ncbi:MAG TPA: hypothetical protein DGT23_35195 [Micromonosporaceae bacterium]|nr:hypothetical protein [Micromonosporaceae bacterium]
MNLQVKPDTLLLYGELVARTGLNMSLVGVDLAQNMKLGSTDGLWLQTLITAHEETTARMSDSIDRGFRAMTGSGTELKRTATYYQATDQKSAADLDSTYPASARPAIDTPTPGIVDVPGKAGPYEANAGTDVEDPSQHTKPPGQPQEFTDPLKFFNVVSDFMSPSWWMNQVLNDTIGCNPLEFVVDKLVGDWEGFARCAVVWEHMSKATGAIGENVKCGLTWLAADWQGQAADAAVHYFDYTRQALDSHRDVLHHLHEKYLDVARGVWNAARSLADLLKSILDNVIVAGVAVLAAWWLSWTGVGAGISLAVAALECANIWRLWDAVTGRVSDTQTLIEGFVGFIQSQEAHVLNDVEPTAMPATDYDHPAVAPESTIPTDDNGRCIEPPA